MHFVSSLNDFCPGILSVFNLLFFISCINYNIIFVPLWDQYTDSIVPPHMCLFCAVSDNLSSWLSQ